MVALGCALGGAVLLWTRRHFGLRAGAIAFFLCVLSPDMLAHGQIVTTDLAVALFVFLSVIAFHALTERVTPSRVLLIWGNRDDQVPLANAERYASVLSQARVTHRTVIIEGGDHDFAPAGPRQVMAERVAEWCRENLAP